MNVPLRLHHLRRGVGDGRGKSGTTRVQGRDSTGPRASNELDVWQASKAVVQKHSLQKVPRGYKQVLQKTKKHLA